MSSFLSLTEEKVQSKEWLSTHYKKQCINVTIIDMSSAGGMNCIMKKLVLEFSDGPDLTVVMKCVRPRGQSHSKDLGLPRECLFYEELASTLNVKTPAVHFSYGNMETGEKILVLENLSDCIQSGYFFGPISPLNWGKDLKALTASASEGLTETDIAKKAFLMAANLHAKYWNDPSLMSKVWLRSTQWYIGEDKQSWTASQKIAVDAWACVRDPTKSSEIVWNDYLVSVMESSFSKINWETKQKSLKAAAFTLAHGDFHPANMMYRPADDSIVLLDWENVGIGSGPQDLAQYMISHVNVDIRKTIETELLPIYYHNLTSLPGSLVRSSEYSLEECRREFIFGGAERWFWMLAFLLNMAMPTAVKQYFHDIVSRFVNDYASEITTETIGMPRV
jgi:hypothetical protein